MNIPLIEPSQYIDALFNKDDQRNYGAMYSSWIGGIVTDSRLMLVPVDDHMVHRGDAVFEAFKYVYGAFYDLDKHLDRLITSAEFISLNMPWTKSEIVDICLQTMRASGLDQALFRLYLSRGPGDFSVNPYSTKGSQLYVIATPFAPMSQTYYSEGAKLIKSSIPVKPHFFSRVKSCNYMQNVLMKKESVDRKADFAVNFTSDGLLCEGPTENILILTNKGELCAPEFTYTLKGTTLMVVLELAKQLLKTGDIQAVVQRPILENDLIQAKEVMMAGTTLEVLPVVSYEEGQIAKGKVGPVAEKLRQLLITDMKSNSSRRTEL